MEVTWGPALVDVYLTFVVRRHGVFHMRIVIFSLIDDWDIGSRLDPALLGGHGS
jgi:hypothetical protein